MLPPSGFFGKPDNLIFRGIQAEFSWTAKQASKYVAEYRIDAKCQMRNSTNYTPPELLLPSDASWLSGESVGGAQFVILILTTKF